jgi:hypothetical protein
MDSGYAFEKAGASLGYAAAYLVFTAILFLVLFFTKKVTLPSGAAIVPLITAGIAAAGLIARRLTA